MGMPLNPARRTTGLHIKDVGRVLLASVIAAFALAASILLPTSVVAKTVEGTFGEGCSYTLDDRGGARGLSDRRRLWRDGVGPRDF